MFAHDYSFLDLFWTMLILFCWIIWFWRLITICADIFGRKDIPHGAFEHPCPRVGDRDHRIMRPALDATAWSCGFVRSRCRAPLCARGRLDGRGAVASAA